MNQVAIGRALLSVSDKTGLADLGSKLAKAGVELVSTGGTARALREAGLDVLDVSEITDFPEMMDGRVKTLHPKVHGGILAVRDNAEHAAAMDGHDIGAIDLVVVNLYPFEETVMRGADRPTIIENIDIGGPSMVRSAAKNHAFVTIVTDPGDYDALYDELAEHDGATTLEFRKKMAAKAFAATATYDAMISQWFAFADQRQLFPAMLAVNGHLKSELRYGENPHQQAALYTPAGPHGSGIAQAEQLQGKELSYNNYNDADAALELCAEFRGGDPAVVIVKHANPCGVAQAGTLLEAWKSALECDSVSAFGGIVCVNAELDGATAEAICEIFTEVVIAPSVSAEARTVFAKKKNLRLLEVGELPDPRRGGLADETHHRRATRPEPRQWRDWRERSEGRHQARANRAGTEGLPLRLDSRPPRQVERDRLRQGTARPQASVLGKMNRRDSSRIAADEGCRGGGNLRLGSEPSAPRAAPSPATPSFPFADGLLAAAEAGATAVIQPGGSIRDDEVIAAADEAGLAMVFTGMRHFRH